MKYGWKPLVWSLAALALLLLIATPLGSAAILFVMTPLMILFMMLTPWSFAAHAAGIAAAAFLLGGPYGPLALTMLIFFLVPSVVMGILYKKQAKARSVILGGFLVILAQLLLELVLFSLQYPMDMAGELSALLKDSLLPIEQGGAVEEGWAAETANAFANAIITLMPFLLILLSFLFAVINHGLARQALRRTGIEVPGLPEPKAWKLSRAMVWYYLIVYILSYMVPAGDDGFWAVIIANLEPLLRYAFVIQAIGFFFFLADVRRWSKAVPVLIAIPVILFPPMYLIGLLDTAFPLRRYFENHAR